MSQRHRSPETVLPLKQEVRAHAHSERHRIHVELQSVAQDVSAGLEPEDVHEPGMAWKPIGHHDAEVAKSKLAKRGRSHAPLEDQDVEAPHPAASRPGRPDAPGSTRTPVSSATDIRARHR